LWWGAAPGADDPAAALVRAQRLVSDGPDPDRTRDLRTLTVRPEHLAGVADLAWNGSAIAVGPYLRAGELVPGPAAGYGAVALARGGRPVGLLLGAWDVAGDPVEREMALGQLRDVAATAVDAQWTRDELRRRHRHAHALAEFAHACVSPLNLAEIVDLAGRLAVHATGARGGAVWLADAARAPELRSTHGPLGTRERLGRALGSLAELAMERARPIVLDRVTDEPRLMPDVAAQIQSLAVTPVVAYGRAVGALAVYDRAVSHPAESEAFERADLEFLATLADLAALAEDQSRRCDLLRQADQRQRELQREVSRGARLAALG
jgi:hypothetical protein